TQIEEKLEKAGNPQNIKANDFLAFQVILGVTALFLGIWFLGSGNLTVNSVLLALVLAVLAVYLPWFVLGTMATNRKTEIRRNLPDIMDLLVVSVEAGMGFDMALMKVVERYQGTIAKEFQRALREIQLGKSRKDALKDMEKRVGLMELSSLVNAVVQSDQLGVGISEVLRLQADLIREKRQQWIEEQAMKAPVKMLFPLVFFIFPCIFIILLGPALISMMKTFSNM
ncbi:MAG: type II secretion system F family protein, partial [Desulfitobacteriaceae bacterium]|nr:type II secretion system F family protein [Desulfitobacteriaceae bacterium]